MKKIHPKESLAENTFRIHLDVCRYGEIFIYSTYIHTYKLDIIYNPFVDTHLSLSLSTYTSIRTVTTLTLRGGPISIFPDIEQGLLYMSPKCGGFQHHPYSFVRQVFGQSIATLHNLTPKGILLLFHLSRLVEVILPTFFVHLEIFMLKGGLTLYSQFSCLNPV